VWFSIGIEQITEGRTDTMADELRMALLELLHKAELEKDTDFLRDGVRVLGQAADGVMWRHL